MTMESTQNAAANAVAAELALIRKQLTDNEARIAGSERKLRVTWAVSVFAALAMLTVGWHKDAIAQGYGITLAQAATRIAALETKTASMTTLTDPNTNAATVRFTGVNVQIVDGTGSTEGTQSGLGNLIVGYNEKRNDAPFGDDTRTGSHNLIVGLRNNYSGNGSAVFGYGNTSSANIANIVGGESNTASFAAATVSGGYQNTASGYRATVSGGFSNTANGDRSSVSGGSSNTASGSQASVSGGIGSAASGDFSCVSGGLASKASGVYSSISGGFGRKAEDGANWAAGGLFQTN